MIPQIAAIITGHLALRRDPSGKGMAITGLVLGYLCLLGYGAFWLLLIIGLMSYGTTYGYWLPVETGVGERGRLAPPAADSQAAERPPTGGLSSVGAE
ncbi:UNVERIFIED_ORG: hypothetical protein ABID57_002716 [Arthrobacter sp. UYEF1]